MLYLEDYLEMIEHLPQELRDRFTDMREMDLTVQNNMDSFEKRIRVLFSQCRRGELQGVQADSEFVAIRKDYYKALEDADEKVQLANQMYDLVDRYLRRLDSELFKFKCELEADHNGITEILEKRSLELDGTNNNNVNALSQKENRYFGLIPPSNHTQTRDRYRPKPEKRRDSNSGGPIEKRQAITNNIPTTSTLNVRPTTPTLILPTVPTPSVSYSLQHIGAGNAIAAAASQAIAATQQMQQGRRTASLKASYEAIHGTSGSNAHELLIGRELAGAAHNAIQAVERGESAFNNQRRQKKKITGNAGSVSQNTATTQSTILATVPPQIVQPIIVAEPAAAIINDSGLIVEQTTEGEWTYDPNEPRYCICNQVSYGDMVACDNEACPFEWFHYPCVGITQSPKGKWYCPKCTASMKRRGSRK